ncbi:dihydrolipoyllysine-residue succinyltransferase component protein [Pyrus ussuriensis x Pyrus communis]|uniref:Dihydrolipoyllysine-residue succinyltransferase component protein n=1 Tax=Pyrus ussuriensis x Pyrus communis TaxID=2448454 RepID=A0A5N5GIQ1_9ROSA|nr:dihydrolipoyllysine-residue succinyltransferase component protein [Pyrus ussuriensis x Pyrus communis]
MHDLEPLAQHAACVVESCRAARPQAGAKGSKFENSEISSPSMASPPLQVGLQPILTHMLTFLMTCSSSLATIDRDSLESHRNF